MTLSISNPVSAKQTGAGNSLSLAFGSSVTAGDTIVVAICTYAAAVPVVTDNQGNVYVCDLRVSTTSDSIANSTCYLFRAQSVVGGSCTLTITNNCNYLSTQFWEVAAIEVSPIIPSVQNTGAYATSGTTAAAGAITTLAAQSLVIGVCGSVGSTVPALSTTGFTPFGPSGTGPYVPFDAEYQIYSSIQSGLNMSWTVSSGTWWAGSMAYVSAPASGGGVPLIGEGLVY